MTDPRPADKFAIVPIYADSSGCEVKFPTAIMTGDMSAVMARIKDSRQMKEDLRISNEAAVVRREKAALRADAAAFEEAKASFATDVEAVHDVLLKEFVGKLDALAARMDSLEAQRSNAKYDEELPSPPGTPMPDEGEDQKYVHEDHNP